MITRNLGMCLQKFQSQDSSSVLSVYGRGGLIQGTNFMDEEMCSQHAKYSGARSSGGIPFKKKIKINR